MKNDSDRMELYADILRNLEALKILTMQLEPDELQTIFEEIMSTMAGNVEIRFQADPLKVVLEQKGDDDELPDCREQPDNWYRRVRSAR